MSRLDEIRARLAAVVRAGAVAGPWTHDLIAHAPDDLAHLLSEVERLTGEAAAERAASVARLRANGTAWRADAIERGEHLEPPSPMGMSNLTPDEQAAENAAMEPCTVCGWGRKRHEDGGAGAPHPFTPRGQPVPYAEDEQDDAPRVRS